MAFVPDMMVLSPLFLPHLESVTISLNARQKLFAKFDPIFAGWMMFVPDILVWSPTNFTDPCWLPFTLSIDPNFDLFVTGWRYTCL